jgi:hypothetical protein
VNETSAEQWVQLLVTHGAALRAAGVTRIRAGDVHADLAPESPEPDSGGSEDSGGGDPLNDPSTYGGSLPKMR